MSEKLDAIVIGKDTYVLFSFSMGNEYLHANKKVSIKLFCSVTFSGINNQIVLQKTDSMFHFANFNH